MHRCLTSLRFAVFTAALLCSGASAEAQGWLSDRDANQGDGIKLGAYELHPGVGSEVGYNSNVFLGDRAEDSALLRITPHLYLRSSDGGIDLDARDLSFRTGVSGSLVHYFATEQDTDMSVKQDAKLDIKLSRIVSVGFSESLDRSIDPFTDGGGIAGGQGGGAFDTDRIQFNIGTRLGLHSPGGLLKGGLGYTLGVDHFEDQTAFGVNENLSHQLSADSSYQFLPKTAFFWKSALRFHDFVDETTGVDRAERADSTNINSSVGINGGLTPRVGFTLSAGYGAGFFPGDEDYESVIAQVQARWRTSETTGLTLGYDRAFNSAFQGNFARTDRGRVQGEALFSGVLMLRADVEVAFVDFGYDSNLGARSDIHLSTGVSGEYRFASWFAVTAEVRYMQNFTDFVYRRDFDDGSGGTTRIDDPAEYDRLSAFAGVRAFL